MLKRTVAALLWFYAGWYAGSMIAFHVGITEVLGPILGVVAAALVAADPRRMIWAPAASSGEAPTGMPGRRRRVADPA